MNSHRIVVAWLAIATGALGLICIAGLALVFGGIAALVDMNRQVLGLMASFGAVVLAVCGAFSLGDIFAGVFLLRGSKVAEVWLILSSLFSLLKFPLGTAIGGYTLWVLLRNVEPASRGVGVGAEA